MTAPQISLFIISLHQRVTYAIHRAIYGLLSALCNHAIRQKLTCWRSPFRNDRHDDTNGRHKSPLLGDGIRAYVSYGERIIFNRDYTYKTICALDTAISPPQVYRRGVISKRARGWWREKESNRAVERRGQVILQASGYAEARNGPFQGARDPTYDIHTRASRARAETVNVTRKRWCFVVYFGL